MPSRPHAATADHQARIHLRRLSRARFAEAARALIRAHKDAGGGGKYHLLDCFSYDNDNYGHLRGYADEERRIDVLIAIMGGVPGPIQCEWVYVYANAFGTADGRQLAFDVLGRGNSTYIKHSGMPNGWEWDRDYVPFLKTGVWSTLVAE